MKKIYLFFIPVFAGTSAGAATSPIGRAMELDSSVPQYLIDAADAWSYVIGSPLRSGAIAQRISDAASADQITRLYDMVSVLAFNHTAATLFQSNHQLNSVYNAVNAPLSVRRDGAGQNFVINASVDAATGKYEHHCNDDFDFRSYGGGVTAYVYATDGLAFGIGYNYSHGKSHDMPVKMDVTGNIVSLYSKYLGTHGWFLNMAMAAGQSRWKLDKSPAGVQDDTAFNANIYSGEILTGVKMDRGIFFIEPQIVARYTRINTEKHIDAAAQWFSKWWHQTINTGADVSVGMNFPVYKFTIRPAVTIGGGYDILNNGTSRISTHVITGQTYDMPVHAPDRGVIRGGAGIGLYGGLFAADVTYRLDMRNDYKAHNVIGMIKMAF